MKNALLAWMILTGLFWASGPAAAEANRQPAVQAAFVLLAPSSSGQTVPIARVILDGLDDPCPSLHPVGDETAQLAMVPRSNPDPSHFPVTTCEAVYVGEGPMRIADTDVLLPSAPSSVERVAVLGDTGCKPKYQEGCTEDGGAAWPLRAFADALAASDPSPDLVLHMGDYNYRGTPGKIRVNGQPERVYDAGDNTPNLDCKLAGPYIGQNSQGSDTPDSWENWRKDFFEPAKRLLAAAPWIFARGNHELCSRAGPGWFFFLDAGSRLSQVGTGEIVCPPADSAEPLVFHPPYRVDADRLSVLVLDSANACDQGNLHQRHFDRQFEEIARLTGEAPDSNAIWLQSHRPLWGVRKAADNTPASERDPTGRYAFIDRTLQSAYAKHPVSDRAKLVVSGHMHRFQAIGFPASNDRVRPPQLIVGNSGVALEENQPEDPFSFPIFGMEGIGWGLSEFGYLEIELAESGAWKGRLLGIGGTILAECGSTTMPGNGICQPPLKRAQEPQ